MMNDNRYFPPLSVRSDGTSPAADSPQPAQHPCGGQAPERPALADWESEGGSVPPLEAALPTDGR